MSCIIDIAELRMGERAKIVGFADNNSEKKTQTRQLLALGLLPGTIFKLEHIAPFGDPIAIDVRGYQLSLRKRELALLRIERCE